VSNEKNVRKIVVSTIPKFKLYVLVSFVFALIIQFVGLIPPLLMRNVIDIYIPEGDLRNTLIYIIFFVSIPIFTTIARTFYNYLTTVSSRKAGQHLRMLGIEKIIYQPVSYFDKNNSAEIADYCRSDSMKYVYFFTVELPQTIANILSGLVAYVLIFNENIFIALGLLLYIPICVFPSRFFAKLSGNHIKKVIENNAKTAQIVNDTFKGIRFVKTMLLEKIQLAKMNVLNTEIVKIWGKVAVIDNLNGMWTSNFVTNLFTGVVFSASAILVINGQGTLGMLVMILGYLPNYFSAVSTATTTNFDFKRRLAEYDKFFEIVMLEDERGESGRSFEFSDRITFNNVSFAYTEERGNVLTNFSIDFLKNEWTGIVGASGAGKSTMFDLLLKLYDGYDGDILIDEVSIKNINIQSIRQNITKVSQELFLFPGTLKENLLLIKPDAKELEIMAVLEEVGLTSFVRELPDGLDTNVGEDGVAISGGQKQRICLAMGLLRNSKILLLDEVTANVDNLLEEEIKTNIKKLMEKRDITIIAISHRLQFLDFCDSVFIIDSGKAIRQ